MSIEPSKLAELTAAVTKSLRAADALGLTTVAIRLNDAIVALDGEGVDPPDPGADTATSVPPG